MKRLAVPVQDVDDWRKSGIDALPLNAVIRAGRLLDSAIVLAQLPIAILQRVHLAVASKFSLPTRGQQVSLPQRGFDICKGPYSKKRLQKRFHELRDDTFWQIVPEVYDFTQLPIEAMWSLYGAVRYLVARGVKGDFVECGVFFGGASMLVARTLLSLEDTSRTLWHYDSFQGFVGEQAQDDVTWYGDSISAHLPDFEGIARNNIASTGYPAEQVRLVKGDIEKTAANNKNGDIALLRLDTDTYYSTRAELEHFYPRLVPGGILIIDDYGHALGARRAVDEYFADPRKQLLFNRVNFTNRLAVKL